MFTLLRNGIVVLAMGAATSARAQADFSIGKTLPKNPEVPEITRAPGPRSDPTFTGKPANFSGVSGPGQPVIGTGYGGYRTGKEGTKYKGPEPKAGWLDFGNRARGTAIADGLLPPLKPIWDLHLRDTSICNGGDGFYYMTGSSGDNIWDLVDGIELWRSKDLKTWDYMGLVWSVDKDGTWENQYRWVWAPEVHVVDHKLVFTYCMTGPGGGGGTGILVTKSGKPEGPYINPVATDKPLTGGIDATVFQDDDGKIYFTNGAGGTLHLMKPDLSAFDGAPINVKTVPVPGGPSRLGHEGASFFKANGKYYLGAADTYQGRYSSICGVSDKVEGPYTQIHEAVPCGAGGNYFKDNDGNWWCTYFGNDDQSPWREKPGLVKIDFAKDATIFVADEQPAFVLQDGAKTLWRSKPRSNALQAAAAPAALPAGAAATPVPPPAANVTIPDNSKFILTPPPPETPRINGAAVFGVRPGSPILCHVAATGVKPITFTSEGLPEGVVLNAATGNITGKVAKAGTYKITLHAANAKGKADREWQLVVGDTISLTPPMGWNSYNVWSDQINQERELDAAKAMVSSGLADHGWTYVNMDDGWQGPARNPDTHALMADPRKFTDIKAMVDQIHAMGLKVGIYSSPWVTTYAGRLGGSAENPDGTSPRYPGNPPKNAKQLPFAIGKVHFTDNDAAQFAQWGIDYLKYDWGPVEFPETREMWDALHKQDRDIVFSLSNNHVKNLFKDIGNVSTVANAWRTTTDITDNWGRVSGDIGFAQDAWAPFAKPGRYNDADMLVVGVVGWGAAKQHYTKLTVDECYTHISLWCMLSSPLLLGCDMTKLDPFTLSLLTNDEVLAIDQDPLVKQAVNVSTQGQLEVYRKELSDGSLAVGLFNRGGSEVAVTANWTDLKITGEHAVRDLWRQKDLGTFNNSFATKVPSHGVALVKVAPPR